MSLVNDPHAWKTRKNKDDELVQELRVTTDSVSGTFSPTGLTKGLLVTTMTITDVATKIPLSALLERNAVSIQNKGAEILYLGNSNVTADSVEGTTSGWEIYAGSYMGFDITDAIDIYGICETGKSVLIKILELA
jgi:hypothetical protein